MDDHSKTVFSRHSIAAAHQFMVVARACTRSGKTKSQHRRWRCHKAPLLDEKLLAIDGCFQRISQLSLDAAPERLCSNKALFTKKEKEHLIISCKEQLILQGDQIAYKHKNNINFFEIIIILIFLHSFFFKQFSSVILCFVPCLALFLTF